MITKIEKSGSRNWAVKDATAGVIVVTLYLKVAELLAVLPEATEPYNPDSASLIQEEANPTHHEMEHARP